jgi:TolA-binding protein
MSVQPFPPVSFVRVLARSSSLSFRARFGSVRTGLLVALLLPLAGCATKRDIRDLGEELRQRDQAQSELIREIRAEQGSQDRFFRSFSSQEEDRHVLLMRRIRELEDELAFVRELAGASQAGLAAMRDQLARGGGNVVSGGGMGFPSRGGFVEEGMDPVDRSGAGGRSEVDALYTEALMAHGRGSLAAARIGFEEVVSRFPNHELAPDARYYLADIEARDGNLTEALRRFMQVGELHPTAPRVPEALYRAAIIHRDRGESDQARALFTRIVNTWPESEVAELARAFLGGRP